MLLGLLLLIIALVVLINLPPVQTWLVKRVANNFSEKLQTRVSIERINLSLFNKMVLKGLVVEDRHRDTLLYAGSAKLNITDWFFLKDKAVIKHLSLDDARVNMHRTDSVWNHQFILDFFNKPSGDKKKQGIEFDLRELHLNNVVFHKQDGWIGQDMKVALAAMHLYMKELNYEKQEANISSIQLINPYFSQKDYPGKRPPRTNLTAVLNKIPVVSAFKWNNSGWKIQVEALQIKNGQFQNDKETRRAPFTDRFDGQHLHFSNIDATIKNLRAENDTLRGDLKITGKEKSGLEVKQLHSAVTFTPDVMEFSELFLETNKSVLRDYYSMRYHSFNRDMGNFIERVLLEGHFRNSEVHSDDLAIFAPALKNWNRVFYLDGMAQGTIDSLVGHDVKIRSGLSVLDGNFSLTGLPDIYNTKININARNLSSHYYDLLQAFPDIRKVTTPALNKMGQVRFAGQASGYLTKFHTKGNFTSNFGQLRTDLFLDFTSGNLPRYEGSIAAGNFHLGNFINLPGVGRVALNGNVNGQGLSLNTLNVNFDGNVHQIETGGHVFNNIYVVGDFEKRLFKGHLSINDPKVKIESLDGTISLNEKDINLNADARINYLNLEEIGWVKKPLRLSGLFSLNFTGNNIDDFYGTARVYNATLVNDSSRLSFDSLALQSTIEDGEKTLVLQTNEAEVMLRGNFTVMDLPNSFRFFLSRYYPAYISKPKTPVSNQNFQFSVKTREISDYLSLINPRIKGLDHATFSGHLNLLQSELSLSANASSFSYDDKTVSNIALTSTGNFDTLRTSLTADNLQFSNSIQFPRLNIKLRSYQDVSDIRIVTKDGTNLNEAELNASVNSLEDDVRINFFPSSFILKNKQWTLSKDGSLTLRKNFIDASEVKFSQGNAEIVLSTEMSEETDQTHIVAQLRSVSLGDFTQLLVKDPDMEGLFTGTAVLRNPFGRVGFELFGEADSFYLNKKYVGDINLQADGNTSTGLIKFEAIARDSANDFDLSGSYNYKDSLRNLLLNFESRKVDLAILHPYLNTLFDDLSGTATAQLKVSGTPEHLYLTGEAFIDSADLIVGYTKCRYRFKDETIYFRPDEIDLGRITISDTIGNEGVVSGRMTHTFFQSFAFHNLKMETQKLLLLNTTRKDNEQFYGNVTGYANMTLQGPLTGMLLNIEGQPSATDTSHLYLPTGESRASNVVDYIEFVDFNVPEKPGKEKEIANILVNMNVNVNPGCKFDVILDEATGDIITGQGNGMLNIRVGNREPLSMRGTYELVKGEYTFNFQTFLRKPFILNRGTITWNGDPYQAMIDIEAEYIAKNVDVSQLSTAGGYRQKEDITIISHLTGVLQQPEIEFEFRLPEKSEIKNDYIAVKKLADFQNDKAEMNKQVASLLLFNTFISGEQAFLSTENTLAIATNTIGGVMSGWLTNLLNRELEKATDGIISTYVDINPTVNLQAAANQLQANVRAGLRVLLSNRLFVLIGGNIEYNNPATLQLARRGLITPDITVEWLLNKDGSLRVVGFNRTSIDLTIGQRNRSGVQLSYRKNVNRLGDLLRSRKKQEALEKMRREKAFQSQKQD